MNFQKQTFRTLFFLFLLICLLSGLVGVVRVPVRAAPKYIYPASSVVISEFRTVGSAGATDEFVELYNPTGSSIDISNWVLKRSSSCGITETQIATIPAGVILASGQYYLVGGAGYNDTITPDLPGNTLSIAVDGGIALFLSDGTTLLDQVGLCNGTLYKEGTILTSLNTNVDRGYERRIGGANGSCQDDGNNITDFTLITPSDPQNSSSIITCGIPTATPVPVIEVVINEVAWAGTQASAFDEWIELYNPGGTAVDLTDWRVEAADGDPSILLSGLIAPGGYLLLERGIQNVTNISGVVYFSGLLSNSGEALYLLNGSSQIVDTANSNGGSWPAGGGSSPFPSMERTVIATDSDFTWVTFASAPTALDASGLGIYGTPGSSNSQLNVTPTFTSTFTPTSTATFTPTTTSTATATRTGTPTSSPTPAGFLSLIINEVAWAGTAASSSDEWIELYNPSATQTVNLSGWVLKAVDGTPTIALSGVLGPGGYHLLERTDNTTVSDIVADQIFTGDIGNTSETLQLFDPGNRLIDTANSNGGSWPAGNASTFGSMERRAIVADSDTAWITNTGVIAWGLDAGIPNTCTVTPPCTTAPKALKGTPKHANWAISVTATPSPVPTATPKPSFTPTLPPPPPPPLVAINEFVPRPGHDWNNDGLINIGDEYIEILNHGVIDVNLGGYSLDDEANIGSMPYRLPSVTLKPGERIVFYGSETGLLLSDGGDGVRLLKPNGQLGDAYNYDVVKYPDQSYCRLPDNGGLDDWNQNCYPTPGLKNTLSGSLARPPTEEDDDQPLCPISDTLPIDFVWAECPSFGNIWSRFYWDAKGWFGEKALPDINSKWDVYVD